MCSEMDKFNEKFMTKDLLVFESEHWCWTLRPSQSTVGSSVLFLKRHCPSFSLLESVEFRDLHNIIPIIEKILKDEFDYSAINYLMLMMVDRHVHFHVIPRYSHIKKYLKLNWKDEGWPNPPVISGSSTDFSILHQIQLNLRTRISNMYIDLPTK